MAVSRKILVAGATGQQGGHVARCLLSKGQEVRVLTRSPDKAREMFRMGAEITWGDFEDRASLRDALREVGGVFLMGTPFEKGVEAEVEQGKAAIDVCRESGVPHIVYSSVCGADRKTGIPHFDSKAQIEEHLKGCKVPFTVLRPVWFMQNFESPWLLPSIRNGVLSTPVLPNRKLQMIDLADLGEFAAAAFIRRSEFEGQEIDLAGDAGTMREIATMLARAVHRPVRYEPIPEERAEAAVGRDFALMYKWFNTHGYDVDIPGLRDRWAIPLTPFAEFLDRSEAIGRKAA